MVVLAPAIYVWATSLWDTGSIVFLKADLSAATAAAERGLVAGNADYEQLATTHQVRIRVLDSHGRALLAEADHDGETRWWHPLTDLWFGPRGRPDPAAWDASQDPLPRRPELLAALRDGTASRCDIGGKADLLVCAEVRRVAGPEGVRFLHVQRSTARSARALWEDRFQMTQLTLSVLAFAVALTFWLGTRWVRPIESLRDQALARTAHGVHTEPLVVERSDELGEVADAFNTLLAAIERRNEANETFAADLAHELKNPIAAVRTVSEALEPDKPLTPARAARLRRILADSSRRMATVIDRFLELARAEAGLAHAEMEDLDLAELVFHVVDAHRADEQFARVTFTCTREAEGPTEVHGNEERLETAVRNLVANAAAFAGSDGEVHVSVGSSADQVHLEVRDSGPGIPTEDLPRIFDRYFSKRQGGTGLGLPLCKAIARAHNGELSAASPSGSGAIFRLSLPASRSAHTPRR